MKVEGISPLRTIPKVVDARHYNRARLALLRLGSPVRVELGALRVEMELDRRCWVGRSLINAIPLMAWTRFEARGRGLHQSVPCQLHLYHFHAGVLVSTALDHLARELGQRLLPRTLRATSVGDIAWL